MDKEFEAMKKQLARNVRQLRLERGMSQETLAFEAEVDRTYVSQLERSLINPSLLVLHKVGRALGATVLQLLSAHAKQAR